LIGQDEKLMCFLKTLSRHVMRRSGRVTGMSPRHPPTPPDVRFSASGG
jgi:hypothetical protein